MRVRSKVIAVIAAVVVSSCAPDRPPNGVEGGAVGPFVRIAAPADGWPDQGSGDRSTTFAYPLNVNVYETLVSLAPDYTVGPGLAERWELIEPSTWRFYLRRGVTFTTGRPFTADDVMWSWAQRQTSGKSLRSVASVLGAGAVTKVDDFTVDFTPTLINNRLPEQLSHPAGAIVARGSDFDSSPAAGTGPFRVVTYRPEELVVLERNETYWGTKPAARRLIFRFIPDSGDRAEALISGDVNLALDLDPQDAELVATEDGLRITQSPPGRTHQLFIRRNGDDAIGADRAVRQAVSLALDRQRYADVVLGRAGQAGRWMAPRAVLGRAADLVVPATYDVAQARAVLDSAGWIEGPDGVRSKEGVRLSLVLLSDPELPEAAPVFVRRSLSDAGIEVVEVAVNDIQERDALVRNEAFDLSLADPNQNDGNPAFVPLLRAYSRSPGSEPFAPGGDVDGRAEMALAAPSRRLAQQAAAELMRVLVNEEYLSVPLAGVTRLDALGPGTRLRDLHPSLTNQSWSMLDRRSPG